MRTLTLIILPVVWLLTVSLFAQGTGPKEPLDLPYDAYGLTEEEEEAPEVVVFYGQNYEGDGIFYCLDRSSSTCNGELNIEKRETIRNITEFSDRVEFGIVFYDSGIMKFPRSTNPVKASQGAKAQAVRDRAYAACGLR